MLEEFYQEFSKLRKVVHAEIGKYIEEGEHHKSYEGEWFVSFGYPNYFEDESGEAPPDFCKLELHCYLIGPSRHYEWTGDTWQEAIRQCKKDLRKWIPGGIDE